MGSFRTSSVFKFTKDFDLLTKIINNGIIPNYCEEDLSFGSQSFCVGVPISSFCDIPITLLDEHTRRYGNYGLALSKKWAIQKGITPIMYIANDIVLQSVHYYHKRNQDVLNLLNREDIKKDLVLKTALGGFPLGSYAKLLSAQTEHAINTHIIGYLKKYEGVYRNSPINNYEENEWRFLVPDEEGTKWFWSKDDYQKWRFPNGTQNADKPSPSEALKKYTLEFGSEDVSYLLVKNTEFKSRLIAYIKELKTIGGKAATQDNIDDLISKIITLEQVKKDF